MKVSLPILIIAELITMEWVTVDWVRVLTGIAKTTNLKRLMMKDFASYLEYLTSPVFPVSPVFPTSLSFPALPRALTYPISLIQSFQVIWEFTHLAFLLFQDSKYLYCILQPNSDLKSWEAFNYQEKVISINQSFRIRDLFLILNYSNPLILSPNLYF